MTNVILFFSLLFMASVDGERPIKAIYEKPGLSVFPLATKSLMRIGFFEEGEYVGKIRYYKEGRFVRRGSQPEIIIKGDQISIDSKFVSMGQLIEDWMAVIPGKARCDDDPVDIACDWDELGITILTKKRRVTTFEVYFNKKPWSSVSHKLPNGMVFEPLPDPRPKKVFQGHFEWDGYGINASTKFWEIRGNVDAGRNVRCDPLTNNCGNTTARFNNNYKIYLELLGSKDENGRLESFAISKIF